MQTNIFSSVLNQIKRALTGLNEFAWVDLDQGQIDNVDSYPIPFPAALIDIADITYELVGEDSQVGNAIVTIRLAYDVPEDLNHLTPETSFNQGLKRFELTEGLFELLENLNVTTEGFTRLTRTRQTTERRQDRLRVIRLEFTTVIWADRPEKYGTLRTIPRPDPEFPVNAPEGD